ncbi:MAG TPA: sulfatase-like hydrolase/transferase [Mycobacteriales bacterium]|nr:sulfatase-like hydrolase/transferase [Mycobacteriales bacterium]
MSRRPNVLIVMSDEQSWDTMGCTGNPAARTPNLDSLCAESTSFDHAYTPFPLCCPSRASLWTSRMPRHHGVLGNWRPIVPQLREAGAAQAFRQAGYHTIYTGKWHVPGTTPAQMGWADASAIPAVLNGRDRGRYIPDYRDYAASHGYQLDEKHIENLTAEDIASVHDRHYGTASIRLEHFLETWQTGEFLQALDRRPDNGPWLATCSYNAPHFPMVVPAPYDRLIDRSAVRLPDGFDTGPKTKPREVRESRFATEFAEFSESGWIEIIAHYLGLCALIDAQFGRIREHLEARGEWDNTIVVFTSDHGDLMGAHRLMEKGHFLHYEQDLRIPLLVRHPDAPASRTGNLVSICDIGPTLAELAGVPWDGPHDGRSFAGQLGRSDAAPIRDHVTAETTLAAGNPGGNGDPFFAEDWAFPRDSLNLSVRTPDERYIFRSHDEDEFYDHRTDPAERWNVAADPDRQDRRAELRTLLADEIGDSFSGMRERLRC